VEKIVEQRAENEEGSFDEKWWAVGRNRVVLLVTGLVYRWRWRSVKHSNGIPPQIFMEHAGSRLKFKLL
jgi:hypothetical protein